MSIVIDRGLAINPIQHEGGIFTENGIGDGYVVSELKFSNLLDKQKDFGKIIWGQATGSLNIERVAYF